MGIPSPILLTPLPLDPHNMKTHILPVLYAAACLIAAGCAPTPSDTGDKAITASEADDYTEQMLQDKMRERAEHTELLRVDPFEGGARP